MQVLKTTRCLNCFISVLFSIKCYMYTLRSNSFATDEEKSRLGRSLETEDSQKSYPVPTFKTLKVALMCPPYFAAKYSSGKLNVSTGGVENYLLLLANMVGFVYEFISGFI